MPWSMPALADVRKMTRDKITSILPSASLVANNPLRIMSDAASGLAHLCLLYIQWVSKQLLPDSAEAEWLDRHGNIWLTNADGSKGRKAANTASGRATATGTAGGVIPIYTIYQSSATQVQYETTEAVTLGDEPTPVPMRALTGGIITNLEVGDQLTLVDPIDLVDDTAIVVSMTGGTDEETTEEERARVLDRIQEPPMGGAKNDYVQWAKGVAGVTRAWSYPNEMGIGTVTVRFMADDLRSELDGFPLPGDVENVRVAVDLSRPVALKDFFVEAPIKYPIDIVIANLDSDTISTRAAIEASLRATFKYASKPGQTWFRAWTDRAISNAAGVNSYDLVDAIDEVMPSNGYMPAIGSINYE